MASLVLACLGGCAGGGGGLSAAGPVILEEGTDRFADGYNDDSAGDSGADSDDGADDSGANSDGDGTAPAPRADSANPAKGGTPTPGTVPDPVFYETAEYYGGQWRSPLEMTRFSDAYARGWTGLGSLVTVADMTSRENVESIRRTIGNVEQASQEVVDIAGNAAEVTSGVVQVASGDNIARVESILDRLDRAAIDLESTMVAASRATERMEPAMSDTNMMMVTEFLTDLRLLQGDIAEIVSTSVETSKNVNTITEFSEDRLDGFLRRMEAAALNIEEMTSRLRDDPSLIIRGTE